MSDPVTRGKISFTRRCVWLETFQSDEDSDHLHLGLYVEDLWVLTVLKL